MTVELWAGFIILGVSCVGLAFRVGQMERDAARLREKLYELTLENVGLRVALRQKAIRFKQPEKWPAVDVYNKRILQATLWLN